MIYIYNALSVLLFGFAFKNKIKDEKVKRKFLTLCFLQMFIIQGFRASSVGTDTSFYLGVYDRYLGHEYEAFLFTHFEPGFQAMYSLLHRFNLDGQYILIICSAFTLTNIALIIYIKSDDVVLSTWLFACMFFPNSCNIMRQYLAASIALWSYVFITDKKYLKAFISIGIALLFHTTALLFLIPIIIYKVKNWNLIRNSIIFLSVIIVIFGNRVMTLVLSTIGKGYYLSSDLFGVSRLFRMTTFFTFVFAFVLWDYMKNNTKEKLNDLVNFFFCVSFMNFTCGLLYLRFEYFSRIIELFNMFLMFAFPLCVVNIHSKYKQLVSMGLIIVPAFLLINQVYNSKSGISEYAMFFCDGSIK